MAALEPSDRLLETSCGSPHYASPEIVAGMSYHGAASDIWSCGVILFALLTGRLPFDDENIRILLQKVKSGRFTIPADLPADAKDLITRMLVVEPERRISMADIMSHPFFQRRQDTDSGRRLNLVEPPRLEEIARPVKSEKEIDRDILRNLRTLWHGASDREIVQSLLSNEKTWEKAFYFLLLQYRNKHLENFNPEPEQQRRVINEKRRKPDESGHRRSSRPVSSNATRKAVPREERHRIRHDDVHTATRPAPRSPATPSRVAGPRPPTSPALGLMPTAGATSPRTPAHLDQSSRLPSTVTPVIDPRLPKITLQRPTPQPESSPAPAGLGLSIAVSPPASPTPSPILSITSSPPLGGINVPQVQDAALQKFFHDIAEQLQLIGFASPRSSLAMDSPMQSPALSQGETTASSSPLPTPTETEAPVLPAIRRPMPSRAATDQPTVTQTAKPEVTKRRSYLGDASERDNAVTFNRHSIQVVGEKVRKPITGAKDSRRKSKPAPLDLSPRVIQTDQLLSPTHSPYLGTPPLGSAPPSPLLIGPSSEMKQSWFSNLFSWKPATYTLISADDCASSRAECIKLLESFGASVILEDADGWGMLKCRVDEIRDVTGITIPKSVRFRIEFLPHAQWASSTGSTGSSNSPRSPNPSIRGQGTGLFTDVFEPSGESRVDQSFEIHHVPVGVAGYVVRPRPRDVGMIRLGRKKEMM
ncbi:MAG: hypothetical protein TREMPRED_004650 [Tremellales sp. Tagirdzhanova-0007]|nr:MAG: hypothetical protein TREMPRED_004650 [Tremellales sp. Tagirdzhanova-0007]